MFHLFFKYLNFSFIKILNPLQLNTRSILAISGGQDSIFLFMIVFLITSLTHSKKHINIYLNHLIQKNTFFHLLHNFQISYLFLYSISSSMPFFLLKNEQKSSQWRYLKLYRICYFYNFDIILFANTNTDYSEKFFLNIFRGCSQFNFLFIKDKINFLQSNKYSNHFYRWS